MHYLVMRQIFVYVLLGGFLMGVGVNTFLQVGVFKALCVFVVCFCFLLGAFCVRKKLATFFLVALAMFSVSAGILRYSFTLASPPDDFLETHVEKDVEFSALVVEQPDVRETSMRLTLLPRYSDLETRDISYGSHRIIVSVGLDFVFSYGDVVSVSGVLARTENFETDTGREFDYVSYLAKDNIFYQMNQPKIALVAQGEGNFFKRHLLRFKKVFVESLRSSIPEPQSSLASGILLGEKHSLGKELTLAFRQTGLVHIIVLSGYNVTIVADCIVKIFSFLPKMGGLIGAVFGIVAFAVITGAGATVVRASVMACIVLVGRFFGKEYDIMRALSLAATLMVFHNPRILLSDPSFQLSCLATFSLVALSPYFEKRLWFLTEKFQIRACVASTLATQIFLLPLLVYMTGMISVISLVTNLLILLVVPVAMGMSFLAGIAGFFGSFVGSIFGYFAYLFLEYMLLVVEIFSKLPFAYFMLPQISSWLVLAFYAIFAVVYVKKKIKINEKTGFAGG